MSSTQPSVYFGVDQAYYFTRASDQVTTMMASGVPVLQISPDTVRIGSTQGAVASHVTGTQLVDGVATFAQPVAALSGIRVGTTAGSIVISPTEIKALTGVTGASLQSQVTTLNDTLTSSYVTLGTAQSISGAKTFSAAAPVVFNSVPVFNAGINLGPTTVSSQTLSFVNNLTGDVQTQLNQITTSAASNNANAVTLTGTQTLTGIKTFNAAPTFQGGAYFQAAPTLVNGLVVGTTSVSNAKLLYINDLSTGAQAQIDSIESRMVTLLDHQTIDGVKTFGAAPVFAAGIVAGTTSIANGVLSYVGDLTSGAQAQIDSIESRMVTLLDDQTIHGVKTFTSVPVFEDDIQLDAGLLLAGSTSVAIKKIEWIGDLTSGAQAQFDDIKSRMVTKEGAQTVAGQKTFGMAPVFAAGIVAGTTSIANGVLSYVGDLTSGAQAQIDSIESRMVTLLDHQTIDGVKTFTSVPVFEDDIQLDAGLLLAGTTSIPVQTLAYIEDLTSGAQAQIDSIESRMVTLLDDQTIDGVKTFSAVPVFEDDIQLDVGLLLAGATAISIQTLECVADLTSGAQYQFNDIHSRMVTLADAQAVSGNKTFSGANVFQQAVRLDAGLTLVGSTAVSNVALGYLAGVSSGVQSQLDSINSRMLTKSDAQTFDGEKTFSSVPIFQDYIRLNAGLSLAGVTQVPLAKLAFMSDLTSGAQAQLNNVNAQLSDMESRMVTLADAQSITGELTFTAPSTFEDTVDLSAGLVLAGVTAVSMNDLEYIVGLETRIQGQLDTLSGGVVTLTDDQDIGGRKTFAQEVTFDAGICAGATSVSNTELAALVGVTGNVQAQLISVARSAAAASVAAATSAGAAGAASTPLFPVFGPGTATVVIGSTSNVLTVGNHVGTLKFQNNGFQTGTITSVVETANDTTSGALVLSTAANSSSLTERMRISKAGLVGIGTNAPSHALDVSGDINLTGNLLRNGAPLTLVSTGTANGLVIGVKELTVVDTVSQLSADPDLLTDDDDVTLQDVWDKAPFAQVLLDGTAFNGGTVASFLRLGRSAIVSGQFTCWYAMYDGAYTRAVQLTFDDSQDGIEVHQSDAAFWHGQKTQYDTTGMTSIFVSTPLAYTVLELRILVATDSVPMWETNATNDLCYMDGRVGVGTTSPAFTLDVHGDVNLTGNLFQNGQKWAGSGAGVVGVKEVVVATTMGNSVATKSTLTSDSTITMAQVYINAPFANVLLNGDYVDGNTVATYMKGSQSALSANTFTVGYTFYDGNFTKGVQVTFTQPGGTGPIYAYQSDSMYWSGRVFQYTTTGMTSIFATHASGYTVAYLRMHVYISTSQSWTPTGTALANTAFMGGNVGIGTTSPLYTLDVNGNVNFEGALYQRGAPFTTSQWTTQLSGDGLSFVAGAGAASTRIGVGTNSPAYTLDVAGDINLTGQLTKNGAPYATNGVVGVKEFVSTTTLSTSSSSRTTLFNDASVTLAQVWQNAPFANVTLNGTSIGADTIATYLRGSRSSISGGGNSFTIVYAFYDQSAYTKGVQLTFVSTASTVDVYQSDTMYWPGQLIEYTATGKVSTVSSAHTVSFLRFLVYATGSQSWAPAGSTLSDLSFPSGNIAIGKATAAYRLDVAGDMNVSGALYHGGWVGIGTTAPATPIDINSGPGGVVDNLTWRNSTQTLGWLGYSAGANNGALGIYAAGSNQTVVFRSSGHSFLLGGNFGMGTSTPSQLLHVSNSSGGSSVRIQHAGTATNYLTMDSNAGAARLFLGMDNSAGAGLFGSGTAYGVCFGSPDALSLNWATSNAIRCTVTAGGNFGVGTSAPSYKLQVNTASSTGGLCHTDGTVSLVSRVGGSVGEWGTQSNHGLSWYTNGSVSQMFLSTGGRLGVGTTAPTTKLHLALNGPIAAGDESLMIHWENTTAGYHDWRMGPCIVNGNAAFQLKGGGDGTSLTPFLTLNGNNGYVGLGAGATEPAFPLVISCGAAGANDNVSWRNNSFELGRLGYWNGINNGGIGLMSSGVITLLLRSYGYSFFTDTVGIGPSFLATAPNSTLDLRAGYTASGLYPSCTQTFSVLSPSNAVWTLGKIQGYVAAGTNNDTSQYPGGLAFYTKTGDGATGDTTAVRMVIDAVGRVGIGTTAPEASSYLHLKSSSQCTNLRIENAAGTGNCIDFGTDNTGRHWAGYGYGSYPVTWGSGGAERMRLDSAGNLGINTQSPVGKFHVQTAALNGFNVSAWNSNHVVLCGNGAASGANSGALGFNSDQTGNCYIASLAPNANWMNLGIAAKGTYVYCDAVMAAYVSSTSGWTTVSDAREKEDVQDLNTQHSFERVMAARPKSYFRKVDESSSSLGAAPARSRQIGLIAQEVELFNPHCLSTWSKSTTSSTTDEDDTRFGLQYNDFVIHLIGTCQQLNRKVEELTARVALLESTTTTTSPPSS